MAAEGAGKSGPIRPAYERAGVKGFYERHGARYRNPHEPILGELLARLVRRHALDLRRVLDLACGSGEATLALRRLGAGEVFGIDPYTGAAYRERTGATAEPLTFEAIAGGALAGRQYSLIVCSFALHLVPASRLPGLAYELARVSEHLVVLTPHKRPLLKPAWRWRLQDELLVQRVRGRYYAAEGVARSAPGLEADDGGV